LTFTLTKEPAEAFHRRIAYRLTTHNDAVSGGCRYPLTSTRSSRIEPCAVGKRKDDKTDEEKAQELEDELDDMDEY
jgi:26S proteasome regulatory subunit N3